MRHTSIPSELTFTAQARTLGIVAAWMTFVLSEIYAVVSGIAYVSQGSPVESGPFISIMALMIVVMGPFLVLTMVAVHAYASPNYKPYSLAALAFMISCVTVTSCINFFLLLVSSQPDLFSELWRALFLPCKWPAPAFILDNFVWDWFFGISTAGCADLWRNKLKTALRLVMILAGVLCLGGGLSGLRSRPRKPSLSASSVGGAAGPFVFLLLAKMFGKC